MNNIVLYRIECYSFWNGVPKEHYQVLFDRMNHYTDHLGNIRLSYGRDPETNEVAILKESHYYPFACPLRSIRGLQHQGYVDTHQIFPGIIGVGKGKLFPVRNYLDDSYRYTFGGKEEQPELGLNWLDFHARNYDAALGRWLSPDPLAEEMPAWSPYRYGFNNPVRYTDPTGMLETNYEDEFGNLLAETNDGNDATVVIPNENVEEFLDDFESTHFMQRDGHSTNAEWIGKYGAEMRIENGAQVQPWAIEAFGYSSISEGFQMLNTAVGLVLSGYSTYNVSNGKFRGASGRYYTFKNRKGWNQYTGTKTRMNNTLSKAKWTFRGTTALGIVNYSSIINQRQEIGNVAFGIEMISNTISTFSVPAVSIPWTIGYEGLGRNGIMRVPWYQNTFKPWARQKMGLNE